MSIAGSLNMAPKSGIMSVEAMKILGISASAFKQNEASRFVKKYFCACFPNELFEPSAIRCLSRTSPSTFSQSIYLRKMWKNCKVLDLIRCAHFFTLSGAQVVFSKLRKFLRRFSEANSQRSANGKKERTWKQHQTDEVSDAGDLYEDLESSPHNPRLSPTLDTQFESKIAMYFIIALHALCGTKKAKRPTKLLATQLHGVFNKMGAQVSREKNITRRLSSVRLSTVSF